ncbi:hypothetical protein DMENIID0001_017130 [Sergentomyia squamirostris]
MDLVNNCNNFIHIVANNCENSLNPIQSNKEVPLQVLSSEKYVRKRGASEEMPSEQIIIGEEEIMVKLGKICRCCLAEDEKLQSIYDEGEDLVEMLMNLAQIQIRLEDILPPLVCFNCAIQLSRIMEFKNQVEMAETTLRQFVNVSCAEEENRIQDPETLESTTSLQHSPFAYDEDISEEDCELSQQETVLKYHSQDSRHDHNFEEKLMPDIENRDSVIEGVEFEENKNNAEDTSNETEFTIKCPECKDLFRFESDLQIHSSIHAKDGKKMCLHCKKEVSSLAQLKRHIKTHFTDKPHKCKICDKGFPEMASLNRHIRKHSGEQRLKKHLCTICGKGYYDAHSLSVHSRNHTGERPCVCSVCGKTFIDSRLLNSHMKVHSKEKAYKCEICQREFTHHSTLTSHYRTHTGEKPYVCSECGKSFIQSSNLTLHMRTHNGIKPYKCETCGRAFASSSTLVTHTRIHTGEKPYKCQVCGKAFARIDLSAHYRTHTGEKPFQCATCSKRFTTKGQMRQHMRVHREENPLICPLCQKRCYSLSTFKSHMKSHDVVESAAETTTEVVYSTKVMIDPEEEILYSKNQIIVQQIHLDKQTSDDLGIETLQIEEIVQDGSELTDMTDGHIVVNPDPSKYIMSNVIQVPIFLSEVGDDGTVENVNEVI